ncbi:4-alpha-glucanotransferase [Sinimarinibacterium flocculans]|uniref:4-alpha-glucanotransferase n=1 Tax=Sinimarinibacterium flocculans TaxID=985250 RepID=UPI0024908D63|nr:4-alpha-glucanotransferase [Sinimarinibacterium flocculans]
MTETKDETLRELATLAGLETQWTDYRGRAHEVCDAALLRILSALEIDCDTAAQRRASLAQLRHEARTGPPALLTAEVGQPIPWPQHGSRRYRIETESGERLEGHCDEDEPLPAVMTPGYHRLWLDDREPLVLAVAPPRCFGPDDLLPNRRGWGIGAQIPSLRRRGDGGLGDLGGVEALARATAPHGCDAITISPMHALFAAWPEHFSPYAPSSRLMRNPLLACAAQVFGDEPVNRTLADTGLAAEFAALEAAPIVDVRCATAARQRLFRALHRRLGSSGHRRPFERWCAAADPVLHEHARFELLHAELQGRDAAFTHWRRWPSEYRDPQSDAVSAFAAQHADELEYRLFEQWLVEHSLSVTQASALGAGLSIGLIGDLAVGTDGGGSHAWSRQQEMLIGLGIGAPPDELNVKGQNWGLTAFSPRALQQHGFRAFIELLRASMRHVGGVRIDHAFGLQRLWLVPEGSASSEGAYLRYPCTDLMRLIALESWRHRCIVVGEDLGTMPPGFHDALQRHGVLGMNVMWFERDHGLYKDPARWRREAVAMTTTHDLPTVAGWWSGRDLDWRTQLDLLEPGTDEPQARAERDRQRSALWDAFRHAGIVEGPQPPDDEPDAAVDAALRFVAATPCALTLVPVEDILGDREQPNIPGTTDEHPNWRRRIGADVETAFSGERPRRRLEDLGRARGKCSIL